MSETKSLSQDRLELVSTLADEWRVTPQAIYQWVNDGRLPAHRLGRSVRIRRDDAEKFLEESATAKAA